ncbi:hypothetical protein CISG_10238 [Coccidioides immitis RMSCC 3703]|uniref:Uncharacterized protein n=1 Tax=Coccidioides immitis RMSCC 3703 TaxID=454286 RepID=A0A0J8QN08_COCIT|nr:hypothetical protein CISG_10238 [Coccidioides immitis RMSCC 3703]
MRKTKDRDNRSKRTEKKITKVEACNSSQLGKDGEKAKTKRLRWWPRPGPHWRGQGILGRLSLTRWRARGRERGGGEREPGEDGDWVDEVPEEPKEKAQTPDVTALEGTKKLYSTPCILRTCTHPDEDLLNPTRSRVITDVQSYASHPDTFGAVVVVMVMVMVVGPGGYGGVSDGHKINSPGAETQKLSLQAARSSLLLGTFLAACRDAFWAQLTPY